MNKLPFRKKFQRGFTLIELLVAIAVVAVLSAAILVAINPARKIAQANDAKIKSDIGTYATAANTYYTTNSSFPQLLSQLYPPTGTELAAQLTPPGGAAYNIASVGAANATCNGTSTACTTTAIWYRLNAGFGTANDNWCWDSTNVKATEYTGAAPATTSNAADVCNP